MNFIEPNTSTTTPRGIRVISVLLAGLAIYTVFLFLFTGTVSSMVSVGAVLFFGGTVVIISIALYQQRPIGWAGSLLIAITFLIYTMGSVISAGSNISVQQILAIFSGFALFGYLMANRSLYLTE
ncbi:hypothetical protein K0C01_08685 [Salinarchaeum sp. IM2453]|uniref:hypothetical protein n=1 Tax=Salinarchaeum sp. IM2453 TaxID=2862870 RepID=UPI001C8357D7|nr:hypothetical protein [Salinarchaeum sp. IM2453]QZA87872.1 hypothetical protein K0C01_08685 [Salinarchaeum sp. IM2453]